MAILELGQRTLNLCERVLLGLAEVCLVIMFAANMINIAVRAVFDRGLLWVFPWTAQLFVWMVFFGFFVVYRRGRDITVDFLIDRLGPVADKASRLFVNGLVLGLMGVMLWLAPWVLSSQVGKIEMIGLERYTLSIPLLISCALIFVDFTLDTVNAFRGLPRYAHRRHGSV